MIIRTQAYPRAALIGNPSDGYFGKTIAFTFGNFRAETLLYESPELEIQSSRRDESVFSSLDALADDVRLFGYYGGIRLIKAALKSFHGYCRGHGIQLHGRNFTIRYHSDIPNLVGLAGSSAIITACMRALMSFYGVQIPPPQLANLIRAVENRELGISAGLQDRVAQVYQGLVYMDFDRGLMEKQGFGHYVPLDASLLPPLYIAYRTDLSEGSEVFHNNIRDRFNAGEPEVVEAMQAWARLTDQARDALLARDYAQLSRLMNTNFDLRARLYNLSEGNLRLVQAAREAGASAKFSGSGGAIVGICPDEATFVRLQERLAEMQVNVIRPQVVV
jgi:glucuronokinase